MASTGSWLSTVWRAVRHLGPGWLLAGPALFLAGFAAFHVVSSVDVVRAQYLSGVSGQVTVTDCEWYASRYASGWQCSGTFDAADGSVRELPVEVRPELPEWPEEPVPTLVSGPTATVAQVPDRDAWWGVLWMVLVPAGVAGWLGWKALRTGWETAADRAALDVVRKRRPQPAWPQPPSAPVDPEALPPNPVLPALVAWQAVLLLAVGWLMWDLAAWNRTQDQLLSATVAAEVVATHLGRDQRIEVVWEDGAGERWTRLTPVDPDRFGVRGQVELRYDPDHPDTVYPVDRDAFQLEPRGRNVGVGLLLAPGLLLAWAWTWRLGRWALGRWLGRRRPALVALRVAAPRFGDEPVAFWLELSESDGTVRYQRVVRHRGLTRFALTGREEPAPATVRRCPGLRRMLVVDLPGAGRLWPASTARRRPPRSYDLTGFDLTKLGSRYRGGWPGALLGAAAILVLLAMAGLLAGLPAAGYVLASIVSFWFWHGAAPWHGLYAYQPPPDEEEDEEYREGDDSGGRPAGGGAASGGRPDPDSGGHRA